ncbi:hypothetical protein MMC20_003155 [Loxospora ochrophaea]|nr:hypothetical protein [Loxospora ochrophaea]
MDSQNSKGAENKVSTVVLLKYLIAHAIRINTALHTNGVRLQAYLSTSTETEWLNILDSVLQGNPLYIIIDMELLDHSLPELSKDFSWLAAFMEIFSQLAERNIKTVIKVAPREGLKETVHKGFGMLALVATIESKK